MIKVLSLKYFSLLALFFTGEYWGLEEVGEGIGFCYFILFFFSVWTVQYFVLLLTSQIQLLQLVKRTEEVVPRLWMADNTVSEITLMILVAT